jgi:hypothetical protein
MEGAKEASELSKRHPLAVVALTLVTFGVYAYWWLYKTTDELRQETGRDELRPAVDVILTLITFGFWGVWAGYRNAKIAHETLEEDGEAHADKSLGVAAFAGFGLVSGWSWLVAMVLLQEDYNRLAEPVDFFEPAVPYERASAEQRSPSPSKVRVEPEPSERPAPASSWEQAPSAPVFESNAPAPIVF